MDGFFRDTDKHISHKHILSCFPGESAGPAAIGQQSLSYNPRRFSRNNCTLDYCPVHKIQTTSEKMKPLSNRYNLLIVASSYHYLESLFQ